MTALADRLRRLPDSPALLHGATLVLAALGLVLLARLVWLLLAGPELPVAATSAFETSMPAAARSPLAGWHLFGQSGAMMSRVPASSSSLVLRGTFATANPQDGLAFIADGGTERAYRVGDTLPDGAVLVEVHAEEAILSRGGVREALRLPRATGAGGPSARTAPSAAVPPADPSGGYLTGTLNFGSPDLETARSQAAPDLAALADGANLLPVVENGRLVGVRLSLRDPALLARHGLSPEDVIVAVNGIPIDGPERRDALVETLRAGGPILLTVRRGDAERAVTIGL